MSKISDELTIGDEIRDWCDRNDENGCGGFVTEYSFEDICDLADRIDRELVELPKDAHGEYIRVGDTVYGCRSGMEMTISELRMTTNGWSISTSRGYLTDAEVTHTRPDSLERIADELDDFKLGRSLEDLRSIAGRIRKLAKEQGE